MPSKQITTSELDFDSIKQNLKTFLQGQAEFTDYDFEGSSLNILLDILAYNTHYNAIYSNLAVNESFLDSASKRNNVVSLAKALGYVPNSITAATALVNFRVFGTTSTPNTLTIPKYTPFSSVIDGTTYTFQTLEDISTTLAAGEYNFTNLSIREGTIAFFNYTVATGIRFIIPNTNCDLSTLVVRVKDNSTSITSTLFESSDTILDVSSTSTVYFVKELEGELYELEFGDGILGKALVTGNVINIEYLVTNAADANKAKIFTYQGPSLLGGTTTVTTTSIATGGAAIENIESIRFNAPKFFAAQNRAVSPNDYVTLILKNYSAAKSVNVWGGEDNDPPVYGKVFICIKPLSAPFLTQVEKDAINRDILKNRKVISVVPEIVDPKNINVEVETSVYYNPSLTTRSVADIQTIVTEAIEDYNTNTLERFGAGYRNSQISKLIDATDPSIVSNITTPVIHYPVTPVFNTTSNYVIKLVNPINDRLEFGNITSTGFTVLGSNDTVFIEDDSNGNVRLFKLSGSTRIVLNNIGTINYAMGEIDIPSLHITTIVEDLELVILPDSYDIISVRDQIVQIPGTLIKVNVIVDNVSAGHGEGGSAHIFSSSR